MDEDIRTALTLIGDRLDVLARRLDGQRQMWENERARHDRARESLYAEIDAARAELALTRAKLDRIIDLLIPIETRTDNTLARVRLAEDRIAELEREVGG